MQKIYLKDFLKSVLCIPLPWNFTCKWHSFCFCLISFLKRWKGSDKNFLEHAHLFLHHSTSLLDIFFYILFDFHLYPLFIYQFDSLSFLCFYDSEPFVIYLFLTFTCGTVCNFELRIRTPNSHLYASLSDLCICQVRLLRTCFIGKLQSWVLQIAHTPVEFS